MDEAFVLSLNDEEKNKMEPKEGSEWQEEPIVVDADPEQNELLVAPVSDQGHAPQWSENYLTPADVGERSRSIEKTFCY